MDLWTFISAIPGIGPVLPYLTVIVTIAAAVATVLPVPSAAASRPYRLLYTAINWVALNLGQARNTPAAATSTATSTAPAAPTSSSTAAGLALLCAVGVLTLLSACGTTAARQQILTVACAADSLAPTAVQAGGVIATIADPAAVATVTAANTADQAVHPLVQAACAKALAGSKPVTGTVTAVTMPVPTTTGTTP
ncbi:MAG: hypothetical protein P4M00_19780 [Azospirillaceae bacterium]|nr:hypothetical protein [Azospirillaceae bacterium]